MSYRLTLIKYTSVETGVQFSITVPSPVQDRTRSKGKAGEIAHFYISDLVKRLGMLRLRWFHCVRDCLHRYTQRVRSGWRWDGLQPRPPPARLPPARMRL